MNNSYIHGFETTVTYLVKLENLKSYHHIPGSSQPSGNTWFFPRVNLSCLRIEWPTSVGTMDMWWLFWTMPCSLPFGSVKQKWNIEWKVHNERGKFKGHRSTICKDIYDFAEDINV